MWNLFYAADPWGELRQDGRFVALVQTLLNPNTEIKMFYPYFWDEDEEFVDDETRYQQLQSQIAAIGPEKIQERLKAGREAHLAKKKANG